MLDSIEDILATWTGRAQWPSTTARFESQYKTVGLASGKGSLGYSTDDIFTYEVNGTACAAAVHEFAGDDLVLHPGKEVKIQYNPENPKHIYYAPVCRLANAMVMGGAVMLGVVAIMCSVYEHTR